MMAGEGLHTDKLATLPCPQAVRLLVMSHPHGAQYAGQPCQRHADSQMATFIHVNTVNACSD